MARNLARSVGRLRLPRLPNTRGGATIAVLGLMAVGFAIALVLLLIVPGIRRSESRVADARAKAIVQPLRAPTVASERPELWATPTATLVFPSENLETELLGGSTGVVYEPVLQIRQLPLPPLTDAQGRAVVAGLVTLGTDDEAATPGPFRPDSVEPTRLTVALSPAGGQQLAGCVLAVTSGTLRAVGAIGPSQREECQEGMLRLPTGGVATFTVRYDLLPYYRSRDGAWRDGGVLGRTEVRVALRGA
jgi:hypothetical protein